MTRLPGTEVPKRFRPKLRYELLGCALHGHELVGTDAAHLRDNETVIARHFGGLRWYRCLRCDSWLPLSPPTKPSRELPPNRDEIALPLRGRPLRDRFVLRAIAIDRVLHFLVLTAVAVAIFLFAQDQTMLRGDYTRILNRLQGAIGGPLSDTSHQGLLRDLDRLFALSPGRLYLYGAGIGIYALINGIEAVGLWRARRWAEYLTLFEVAILIPVEIHELAIRVSVLKILTLIINLAVVVYLLYAHRLLGIRGGGRADAAERDHDSGWEALERATPTAGADFPA
ncbi:MAG: DUF2127 domain-containing protein [Actinomycetota bacterium]|nr:DUF2127 domain-containing protein [Actinomycetota bacterium]